MKFGVLVFPGSNCDHDTHHAVGEVMGQPVTYLWHESHDLEDCDAILRLSYDFGQLALLEHREERREECVEASCQTVEYKSKSPTLQIASRIIRSGANT